jgi:hypothetical protein
MHTADSSRSNPCSFQGPGGILRVYVWKLLEGIIVLELKDLPSRNPEFSNRAVQRLETEVR